MQKQVGAKINAALWAEIRILAIRQGRTATELLDEAMSEYLSKHGITLRWGAAADDHPLLKEADRGTQQMIKSGKGRQKVRR